MSNSSSPESEPELGSASPEEVVLPPLVLTIAGILCFVVLYIVTRWDIICSQCKGKKSSSDKHAIDDDVTIIDNLKAFPNRFPDIGYILIYPIMTMLVCPMTLFFHKTLTGYFWSHLDSTPSVNDAIACFMTPTGMVYAITFERAISQVYDQQSSLADQLQKEVGLAREIALMIGQISFLGVKQKLSILKIIQENCLNRMKHVEQNTIDKTVNVWNIMQHITCPDTGAVDEADKLVCDELIQAVDDLSCTIPDAGTLHTKMNKFQWLLLESLGFFTFLGVLLTNAQSYRLEMAICIVTVVSITLLTVAVSDLDSPFHGFYRIDVEFLTDFYEELQDYQKLMLLPESIKEKIK